jgi:hypothetical protein
MTACFFAAAFCQFAAIVRPRTITFILLWFGCLSCPGQKPENRQRVQQTKAAASTMAAQGAALQNHNNELVKCEQDGHEERQSN